MHPERPGPEYEGPDEFDIRRSETASPGGRWLGRTVKIVASVAGLAILVSFLARPFVDLFRGPAEETAPQIERTSATVTRVIGPVTIAVIIGGRTATVRYLGVEPAAVGTSLYELATSVNRAWVEGVEVLLERDVTDLDLEGHLLRYVWVDDAMINAAMLAYGLVRHVPVSPNIRYARDFVRIEAEAKESGVGMWEPGTGETARRGAGNPAPVLSARRFLVGAGSLRTRSRSVTATLPAKPWSAGRGLSQASRSTRRVSA